MTTPGAKIAKTEIFFAGLTLPLLGQLLDLVWLGMTRSDLVWLVQVFCNPSELETWFRTFKLINDWASKAVARDLGA